MKRIYIALLLLIFISGVAASFYFPPRIINNSYLRDLIEEQAAQAEITIEELGAMEWSWFPTPKLSISGLRLKADGLEFRSGHLYVVPDLVGWVTSGFDIHPLPLRLVLRDPSLKLDHLPESRGKKEFSPPVRSVVVENGQVFCSKKVTSTLFPWLEKELSVQGIQGSLEIGSGSYKGNVKMATSMADSVDFKGSFNLSDSELDLDWKVKGLDLDAFKRDGKNIPAAMIEAGKVNISGHLKGELGSELHGSIMADSPCLTLKPKNRRLLVSCGSLKADFELSQAGIQLHLHNLEFTHPEIALSGDVKFINGRKDHDGLLNLDIQGRDADLSQIRRALRVLFPRDATVREVTGIVLGGRATSFSVKFAAPLSHIENIEAWQIDAVAEKVPVYVQDADLKIDSVSGDVKISEGILYVDCHQALLRKAVAQKGSVQVGLTRKNHLVDLDMQLKAPLADVYWALSKFVEDEDFQQGIKEIEVLSGSAMGRLRLYRPSDSRELRVSADVSGVHGKIKFLPLNWPIEIVSGQVGYDREILNWHGINFKLASTHLKEVGGELDLTSGGRLQITRAKGMVSAEEFLRLMAFLQADLPSSVVDINSLKGRAYLQNIYLDLLLGKGLLKQWRVSLSPKNMKISFNRDYLPWPVGLHKGVVKLDRNAVSMNGVEVTVQDSSFSMSGRLMLDALDEKITESRKRGDGPRRQKDLADIRFSGTLDRELALFLQRKEIIPDLLFPKLPVRLSDMSFRYGAGYNLSGRAFWKPAGITVEFALSVDKGDIDLEKVIFKAGGRQVAAGRFGFNPSKRNGPENWFSLSFKGDLKAKVLDMILDHNQLLNGDLFGEIDLGIKNSNGKSFVTATGDLAGHNLFIPVDDRHRLSFYEIDLSCSDNGAGTLGIKASFMQDAFNMDSRFQLRPGQIELHSRLQVRHLSDEAIKMIKSRFSDRADLFSGNGSHDSEKVTGAGNDRQLFLIDLMGEISFFMEQLDLDVQTIVPTLPSHDLRAENIAGVARFEARDRWKVQASSNSMCGSELEASLERRSATELHKHIRLKSPKEKQLNFQDFFTCLGVLEKSITGPFSMDLLLDGINESWTQGYLRMKAEKGVIARGGFLSRLLGILNLTDLFSLSQSSVFGQPGFPYDKFILDAVITSPDKMDVAKWIIKGRGLNLYATGSLDLKSLQSDIIFFVSPLKTVDSIVANIPIIGYVVGGKHKTLFVIPVRMSGDVMDPKLDVLEAQAVTGVFRKLIINVLKAPFSIFSKEEKNELQAMIEEMAKRYKDHD